MKSDKLRHSFEVLAQALPPRIELGMPWPHDQGYDDYDSPPLIYAAAQDLGGQDFLTGGPANMEAFLQVARRVAEARVVAFWLREATFFSNDGGAGIQQLARGWQGSTDPLKAYIGRHAHHLVEPGATT